MLTVMLVGRSRCGKTTFCRKLQGLEGPSEKTQAIEIVNTVMDTPGEYLENPRFYRALLVSSVQVDAILFMQDCTDAATIFPPSFASMFSGKPVLGLISKIDLGTQEHISRAEAQLRLAGAGPIYSVSGHTGAGIESVRTFLANNS